MVFVLAPTVDLLHPSSLSVCLKCASQMFRVQGCWKRSLTSSLWMDSYCCSTSFLMSMYQAEVHSRKNECQLPAHGLLKKMTVIQTKYPHLNFNLIIYLWQDDKRLQAVFPCSLYSPPKSTERMLKVRRKHKGAEHTPQPIIHHAYLLLIYSSAQASQTL